MRSWLCQRCNSEPSMFLCIEQKILLCQHCSCNAGSSRRQSSLSCYSGCPTPSELWAMWDSVYELPEVVDCEQVCGSGDGNNFAQFITTCMDLQGSILEDSPKALEMAEEFEFHPAFAVNHNTDQTFFGVDNHHSYLSSLSGNLSSSNSLLNLTGESSNDCQDGGVSPMFVPSESQFNSTSIPSHLQARNEAKMRYNEKKKNRLFPKQNNSDCRKPTAGTKNRRKSKSVKTIGSPECS